MKTAVVALIAVVVLGAIAYLAAKPSPLSPSVAGETAVVTPETTPGETSSTKVFDVSGANYSFDVKEIKVKKGDTVTINFTNTEGTHDLLIDEFNVAIPQIQAGITASATFIADKTGTFEYYCSVGKHRQMGMVGSLIVE